MAATAVIPHQEASTTSEVNPGQTIAKPSSLCYYYRMRSMDVATLADQRRALHRTHRMLHTGAQQRHAAESLPSVEYFVIDSSVAFMANKIVTAFVHFDRDGMIAESTPRFYGVVNRPTKAVQEFAGQRLRESHVLAEDLALRQGLWTPQARAASELFVAKMVAEEGNAATYIPDRIAHLRALADEVQEDGYFRYHTPAIVDELELGVEALIRNYPDAAPPAPTE